MVSATPLAPRLEWGFHSVIELVMPEKKSRLVALCE